jgi:hypothetical protein
MTKTGFREELAFMIYPNDTKILKLHYSWKTPEPLVERSEQKHSVPSDM